MTFVGTNVLQGKGSRLSLLPVAPSVSFLSDPRLSPPTLTFSLSHQRNRQRQKLFPLSQSPSARAAEGKGRRHRPEVSWRELGVGFLPLLPAEGVWSQQKV